MNCWRFCQSDPNKAAFSPLVKRGVCPACIYCTKAGKPNGFRYVTADMKAATPPVNVVWFKRDLRITDHRPLVEASAAGPVLALYVVEPDYWHQPDTSSRQWAFIAESLQTLQQDLQSIGLTLRLHIGNVIDALEDIHAISGIGKLWSHVETGNAWTYERDKKVGAFCRHHNIPWTEYNQFSVFRRLEDRDEWSKRHDTFMQKPLLASPHQAENANHDIPLPIPTAETLNLESDACPGRQRGGRTEAMSLLNSFFKGRGHSYSFRMSSPLTAAESCSRLSPHLAAGTLSIREIMARATEERRIAASTPHPSIDLRAIDSFVARLHWHCHFIQKLESEPEIEWRSVHPAFEAARFKHDQHDVYLERWITGQTGYPFVDACMRSLIATGWINFRMRAMLVSFATYHLQLDWHDVGLKLARLFTDYEPGIHWPQVQMQAGQTGINVPRIYNPVKQSIDQDPKGVFIKRWLPELSTLPEAFLHEPWLMPNASLLAYPAPIVDYQEAARTAKNRLTETRKAVAFKHNAQAVFIKHGSRKKQPKRKPKPTTKQLALF
jgi:deoxyribodipyrimidine photo-lyase